MPLIKAVSIAGAIQAWFADDTGSGGKLAPLRTWWNNLLRLSPRFGYYPSASKSVLVVKPQHYATACEMFAGTGVKIKSDEVRYLGAAIGSPEFVNT